MERLITFEGIEGCGKTTQIKLAGEFLKQQGIPFLMTEEPGGTPIGRRIREMLLNKVPDEDICTEAEILLFSAARAQHVRKVILPALKDNKVVLCDRFCDATLAYQGFGRGADIRFIEGINDYSSPGLRPGMTVLFDLPVEVGLKRAMDRISLMKKASGLAVLEDRFEQEDFEFHRKVREGYLSLAKGEPERFRIIEGAADIHTVHRQVCNFILNFIGVKQ
ncbi:MAG: dTMP kinase [Deltaproteobacteria bacterium]|nr:dTMP kinase [Deltaproteobacteria bacterium]